ncbi:MAG: hypothetical protein FRX49_02502 [Trebouxia sp. A1-2]|nr:MAG: hypothetical protein FRX49_02502 [Trebouxia sp. A1-2]
MTRRATGGGRCLKKRYAAKTLMSVKYCSQLRRMMVRAASTHRQPDAAWVCVYDPLQVEGHIQSIEGSQGGDAHNQCQHPEICSAPE